MDEKIKFDAIEALKNSTSYHTPEYAPTLRQNRLNIYSLFESMLGQNQSLFKKSKHKGTDAQDRHFDKNLRLKLC